MKLYLLPGVPGIISAYLAGYSMDNNRKQHAMCKILQIKIRFFILFFSACVLCFGSCTGKRITLETLLMEMIDRESIAQFPEPFYTLRQFSSYNRESISPDSAGWFANADNSFFLRNEEINGRNENVMVDTDGPGSIVRIWMTFSGANAGKGRIRVYIDNDSIPVIEGIAYDFLSGGLIVGQPLATSVSDLSPVERRGHNFYLPIPYKKHCKITYESLPKENEPDLKEVVYYNINYRTYEPGTVVESLSSEILQAGGGTIDYVQGRLADRSSGIDKSPLQTTLINVKLKSEEARDLKFTGSKAIKALTLKLDAADLSRALRTTIIEVEFDGERTIWCPVGDLFGTGYQIKHSNTWYSNVSTDGSMSLFWVMPFEKSCNIRFRNYGEDDVILSGEISTGSWKWNNRSMHFGVSWHQLTSVFTRQNATEDDQGSYFDVNYTNLTGEGVYAGDLLVFFNTAYTWWGEGDEKIYTDDEKFPSHFGTGTEDYYGYAWGGRSKEFSNHPFIAQPSASGKCGTGYVVNIRQRALDAIPFSKNIRVDMELWHPQPTYVNFAPTCYYYIKPGGRTDIEEDFNGIKAPVAMRKQDVVPNMIKDGIIEAENMTFSNSIGNVCGISMLAGRFGKIKLSNNLHLMWKDGKPGDSITFIFESDRQGIFDISAVFNTGPKFGNFTCIMNDKVVIQELKLYSEADGVIKSDLNKRMIMKGENKLTFVVKDNRRGFHMFAFDCVMIK